MRFLSPVLPTLILAAVLLPMTILTGCAAPKTERATVDDYQFVVAEAAAKLQDSTFFSSKTDGSPKAAITTRRAENLTRNLQLTDAERWYLVDKVASAVSPQALAGRNIMFVIPEEKARARAMNDPASAFPPERRPTHVLAATVRSVNRSSNEDHDALYAFEYRITDLASGELLWSATVEYKRVAKGKGYD